MDRPRAKKKVIRAPAVSASFDSTNLETKGLINIHITMDCVSVHTISKSSSISVKTAKVVHCQTPE